MKNQNQKIEFTSIGVIHSSFTNIEGMPLQPNSEHARPGTIEIFSDYSDGLKDLEGFSHLILLYNFHQSKNFHLQVQPFLDSELRGVFATRAPSRPNQIGLSVVEIEKIEGNIIYLKNLDILDSTPLLDIKPYIPEFDAPVCTKKGWLESMLSKHCKTKTDDSFEKDYLK
jgi:tRNA-Thr(GGU) m(6)t(6)A37 methyltransferase TsaA